jgi:type II secretory pathway predicted ATPase ExeA
MPAEKSNLQLSDLQRRMIQVAHDLSDIVLAVVKQQDLNAKADKEMKLLESAVMNLEAFLISTTTGR